MRPHVKICGITDVEDALVAAALGAEFIGLNFFPPSPRYLEPSRARSLAAAVRERLPRPPRMVGVFVNSPRSAVEDVIGHVGLDLVQFHGDEPRADVEALADRAIRVLRVAGRADAEALAGWEKVWGLLLDVEHPDLWGGSGEPWDFASLRRVAGLPERVFIAGGLGPHNVRRAIAAARPWGIDLCSGVEARPGRKDHQRLARLFEEIALSEEKEDGESRDESLFAT